MSTADSLVDAVARGGSPADAVPLLSLPLALLAAFHLPPPARSTMILDHADPTLVTSYTAHFVHLEFSHLFDNLMVTASTVAVSYLLCAAADRRRSFLVVFGTIVLVFPFVLSGLGLALTERGQSLGFSGLAMAFAGFLPMALLVYAHRYLRPSLTVDDAPLLFLPGLAVIAVQLPATLARVVAVVASGLTVLYAVHLGRRWSVGEVGFAPTVGRPGFLELPAVGVVVYLSAVVATFPAGVQAMSVEFFIHFVGFGLGHVTSYAAFSLLGWD